MTYSSTDQSIGRADSPRLVTPIVCLVTDRFAYRRLPLRELISQAVEGGVNMVQVREKDLPGGDLLRMSTEIKEAVAGRALLIINERVDVALAVEADGVHLGESALPIPVVRRLVGDRMLVGASVHTVDGAVQAEAEGADYLIVGTIFSTSSKPEARPRGVGIIRQVRERVRVPIIAIGGINPGNAGECIAAGADGVAVISWIIGSSDPHKAAAELRDAVLRAAPAAAQAGDMPVP